MIRTIRKRAPRIDTVRRRIDDWRQTRDHARARLPPRLWAAAVALVPEHGLYGTARALGVSYGALRRHLVLHGQTASDGARTAFVELPTAPGVGTSVIEIADAVGRTVRVYLNGLTLSEVADFARRVAAATT